MTTYDIGFLGGGQLARMSIAAAQRMGLACLSLDPGQSTPASQLAPSIVGRLDDPEKAAEVFRSCRVVTLENEFIPAEVIRSACLLAGRDEDCLTPGARTLGVIQDKLKQRQAYARFGAPSPTARELTRLEDAPDGPCVLKARFGGYDGKGTRIARSRSDVESFCGLWEAGGWLVEDYVPFRRELAVMVARSAGQTVCFPTMETIQTDNVCDLVFPSGTDAGEAAIAAVESVEGFGLFGVELFEAQDGSFLVNEIAPRPHNTGHYTLDWGGLSQFEAHVRLCLGLPLPEPAGLEACMANLLAQPGLDWRAGMQRALAAEPTVHFHWYGKEEMKLGRKVGHISAVGPGCRQRAENARRAFFGEA